MLGAGLAPDSEYATCLEARSPGEFEWSNVGPPVKFTTLASSAPLILAERTQEGSVTPYDGTLEAVVNSEDESTTYVLEYAVEEALIGTPSATTIGEGALLRATENRTVGPVDLGGGLESDKTYYYRLVATNATGTTKGPIEHFTTLTPVKPSVTGERLVGASFQAKTDTIEAQLSPEFQAVTACEVQYVTEKAFHETGFTAGVASAACVLVPPAAEFGQGAAPVAFTATLSELREDTAYEYRVVASNGTGTLDGTAQLLARTPPLVTGAPQVAALTQFTALIALAPIAPEIEAPLEAEYYVLYGTNTVGEAESPHVRVGSGLTPLSVGPVLLSGLASGSTYHYALVAYNGNATYPAKSKTRRAQ